jgi:sugar/nucleoside kinase (ribokinase family)
MKKNQALFLGLTVIDIQYLLPDYPAPNSKHRTPEAQIAIGGPAANAAATYAYLGGEVRMFTVIGDHSMTSFMDAQYREAGVQWTDLAPERTALPVFASVWTAQRNGDRTIVSNERQETDLDLDVLHEYWQDEAEVILVDGFFMEAAIALAKRGQAAGIPVVMDGGSWKPGTEELLRYVDILICSADFRVPGGAQLQQYVWEKGVQKLAVTNGGKPVRYWEEKEAGEVPVPRVEVVDTLGAGDVFHGAFCYHYAENGDFVRSLAQAAQVAARSCQYLGALSWRQE